MTVAVRLLLTFTTMMTLMHVAAGISCYSCHYQYDPDSTDPTRNINCAPPFNSAGIMIGNGSKYCITTKDQYGGMNFLHDTKYNGLICQNESMKSTCLKNSSCYRLSHLFKCVVNFYVKQLSMKDWMGGS